ncbi:MAG: hypothetical protein EAX81_03645 [Candidatus Thorarchaeota archaeon]|nr:hypothetical protein [Candidatus Thorarchaeota archaeon]
MMQDVGLFIESSVVIILWTITALLTLLVGRRLSGWARNENRDTVDDFAISVTATFCFGLIITDTFWFAFQVLFYIGQPLNLIQLFVFVLGSMVSILISLMLSFSSDFKKFRMRSQSTQL